MDQRGIHGVWVGGSGDHGDAVKVGAVHPGGSSERGAVAMGIAVPTGNGDRSSSGDHAV